MTTTNRKAPSACNTKGFDNHTTNGLNFATGWTCGKAKPAIHPNRASIPSGARHTSVAGNPPDSGIFSRPEFMVLGVGSAYPRGRQQAYGLVSTPHIHPSALDRQRMVFVTPVGAETMTNVIPLARTRAAESTQSLTSSLDIPRQQAAIENALSMAAYYMRQPRTPETLHAAIGKTSRAMTLLKTACADSQIGGA